MPMLTLEKYLLCFRSRGLRGLDDLLNMTEKEQGRWQSCTRSIKQSSSNSLYKTPLQIIVFNHLN